jgi:hypothetical protein
MEVLIFLKEAPSAAEPLCSLAGLEGFLVKSISVEVDQQERLSWASLLSIDTDATKSKGTWNLPEELGQDHAS